MLNRYFAEIKRHGLLGIIRYAYDKLTSLSLFGRGVLIRNPNYIRSEGFLRIGKGFSSGPGLVIDVYKKAQLTIGNNVKFNHRVHIGVCKKITIGDDSLFASNIVIIDHNHGIYSGENVSNPTQMPLERVLHSEEIFIGKRVWVGENVCIMPGVTIGDGAIIGAGSVVVNNVTANTIAVGVPAKIIKIWSNGEWIKV